MVNNLVGSWMQHNVKAIVNCSATLSCSPQVWDKSETGEWHCTASWKVNYLLYIVYHTHTRIPSFEQEFAILCPAFCRMKKSVVVYWFVCLFVFLFQTHSGSVWRVTWAHPEFGQVLASCSFDRTAAVWEEIVGESNDKQRGLSHWVSAAVILHPNKKRHHNCNRIQSRFGLFFNCSVTLTWLYLSLLSAGIIISALIPLVNRSALTSFPD